MVRGFAVQRFGGNDFDVDKHHVSLLCPLNLSVIENFDFPFDEDGRVHSGSCGSLLYFIAGPVFGKIVIWNTTTKQMIKVLHPPLSLPAHRYVVASSGLGYDSISGDYKLVRYCMQCPVSQTGHVTESTVRDSYFDLYSSKCGTWKKLKTPFADIKLFPHVIGLHIMRTGSCYWKAWRNGLPIEASSVVSFDFATEIFHRFPLPASLGPGTEYKLVECYGCLSALVYVPLNESGPLDVEVFVRTGTEWDVIYVVSLPNNDVLRPLDLKDDRCLFLQVIASRGCSQLMAYDLVTQLFVKFNTIEDYRADLGGVCYDVETTSISYAETTDPDSIPVTSMISPNEENEKDKEKEKEKKKKKQEKKKKKKEKDKEKQQEKEK